MSMSLVEDLSKLIMALWTLVSVVVALTPTKKDDEKLGTARAMFEKLSFLQPRNSPGILSWPGNPANRPDKKEKTR